MPTTDFYSDALDSLRKDPDGYFFMMYGQPGDKAPRWAAFAPSPDHLKFFADWFPSCVNGYIEMQGGRQDNQDNKDD